MGKFIGTIHADHDMPSHEDAELFEIGRVWECNCGEQFYRTTMQPGTEAAWSPVGEMMVIHDEVMGTTTEQEPDNLADPDGDE